MKVLGVIPARGGSKRIPRKNLERVGQWSLVERAVRCARECTVSLAAVEVNTDDDEIALLALRAKDMGFDEFKQGTQWRDWWPYYRPFTIRKRACGADGPMLDVLRESYGPCNEEAVRQNRMFGAFQAVACLQPTSPFRIPEDVTEAVKFLAHTPNAMSLVSVNEETGERNGAIYITRVPMLRDGLVFDEHSLKYPMPADRSSDINTPEDLELARRIAEERGW